MKMSFNRLCKGCLVISLVMLGSSSCEKKKLETKLMIPKGHPPISSGAQGHSAVMQQSGITGVVIETMDAGGYTYVQLQAGDNKHWVAAPQCSVKVGDTVVATSPMAMTNFESKTLKRTFEQIDFCGGIEKKGAAGMSSGLPAGHTSTMGQINVTGVQKYPGGHIIAELYAQKNSLKNKSVTVRGKVVKVNLEIMGKNWVHLRDGSGQEGSNDLTITTNAKPLLDQVVVAKGLLTVDKDFGSGYRYEIIVENATVSKEP